MGREATAFKPQEAKQPKEGKYKKYIDEIEGQDQLKPDKVGIFADYSDKVPEQTFQDTAQERMAEIVRKDAEAQAALNQKIKDVIEEKRKPKIESAIPSADIIAEPVTPATADNKLSLWARLKKTLSGEAKYDRDKAKFTNATNTGTGLQSSVDKIATILEDRQEEKVGEKMMQKSEQVADKKILKEQISEGQQVKKELTAENKAKHKFEKYSEPDTGPSRAQVRHEISEGKISETSAWAKKATKIEGTTRLPEHIMDDLAQIGNKPENLITHFNKFNELLSLDVLKYLGPETQWLNSKQTKQLAEKRITDLEAENKTLGWTAILKKRKNNKEIAEINGMMANY